MKNSLLRLQTYWRLGLKNILAVAFYRAQLKAGFFKIKTPIKHFQFLSDNESWIGELESEPASNTSVQLLYFNIRAFKVDSPPNWIYDPYTEKALAENNLHWSLLSDFSLNTGDVKVLWELSRFEWLIQECWQLSIGQDRQEIPIRTWLRSWFENNPANQGVNWKCAQESSIRCMHLLFASIMLNDGTLRYTRALEEIISEHIKRILPTLSYAKAQDNNHGISEAAALFTLGVALESIVSSSAETNSIKLANFSQSTGRRLLENRVDSLISDDGTFSQYSIVYHRMMLDTISFVECIRRRFNRNFFSSGYYDKAGAAANWLVNMIDSESGDAPNIGANDGAFLFNADGRDFREFRPSCQLATTLFCSKTEYPDFQHSLSKVFSKELEFERDEAKRQAFLPVSTGFKVAHINTMLAVLKTPDNRFRPSQSDALHLDVWHGGVNIIRDAGSYSYNPSEYLVDFGSTKYHSTIEIDRTNQMPKLSRFLYGNWLYEDDRTVEQENTSRIDSSAKVISSGYNSSYGYRHNRTVAVNADKITVIDKINGNFTQGVLRWRLCPADWELSGNILQGKYARLEVSSTGELASKLTNSEESRFYLEIEKLPVMEVEFSSDSTITTSISIA